MIIIHKISNAKKADKELKAAQAELIEARTALSGTRYNMI